MPEQKTITIHFETHADDDFLHAPQFATWTVDNAAFLRVLALRSIVQQHRLTEARTVAGHFLWDNEDELRLRGDELVCCGDSFWFTAYPKHGDQLVETESWSVDKLKAVWKDASDGDVIFLAVDEDALRELVEGEDEDEEGEE